MVRQEEKVHRGNFVGYIQETSWSPIPSNLPPKLSLVDRGNDIETGWLTEPIPRLTFHSSICAPGDPETPADVWNGDMWLTRDVIMYLACLTWGFLLILPYYLSIISSETNTEEDLGRITLSLHLAQTNEHTSSSVDFVSKSLSPKMASHLRPYIFTSTVIPREDQAES